MSFYSPLRYPGGKGRVANYFKEIFRENLLYDGTYIEPYAGGASVALSLLFNEYASKIIINDKDVALYGFWYSILHDTEQFIKKIYDTKINLESWECQKLIHKHKSDNDLFSVGFSTFFLNRTNRSGILKAGVIGGKQQAGDWKMDARFNKIDLIHRIEKIAMYKNRIQIYNLDAIELIENVKNEIDENALFYFDPPYYVKGKDLYMNYYNHDDHIQVANAIEKINKQKWIVSYDDEEPIRNNYSRFRQKKFQLDYSAGNTNKKGNEIMIFSDNLYISDYDKFL
ncbi:DNA adenine methylase [Epilithonimonas caeni]|uniref:DNA adenine methylase n=1 Tax=Epilithonimonas caeni TaxID=365343 RepID=UPI0003FE1412|nr:DNA adenine methylase [Epilithonimonas caeni]